MSPKKRKMEKHVKNRCSSVQNCRQLKKFEDRGGGGIALFGGLMREWGGKRKQL